MDFWIAEDGGWPVAVNLDFSADLGALIEQFGLPAGESGQQGKIILRVDITDVNSSDIHVEPPM